MRLNIHGLIDNAKCYQMVRQLRWADGVECPYCHATEVVKNGSDETQSDRQRYLCRMCNRSFDDLTGTVFAGQHQPLSVWMLCLYFMGLNLSNRQIAAELELNETSEYGVPGTDTQFVKKILKNTGFVLSMSSVIRFVLPDRTIQYLCENDPLNDAFRFRKVFGNVQRNCRSRFFSKHGSLFVDSREAF